MEAATAQRGQPPVFGRFTRYPKLRPRPARVALIFGRSAKMWVRRTADELAEIAVRKERTRRSPRAALLFAASFAGIAFFFWAIGVPGKFSQRPPDPKSWWQIVHYGPQHFALLFGVLFLLIYGFQLLSGRNLMEPPKQTFICPDCHTPQHADERQCSCSAKLEPLEDWKWK